MQRLTMVRYATKPGKAEENERLALAVSAELRARAPDRITYALFRNGDEFVHLFCNSAEADARVLTELPSFQAYLVDLPARCLAPPEQTRFDLRLLASYGLAPALAPA